MATRFTLHSARPVDRWRLQSFVQLWRAEAVRVVTYRDANKNHGLGIGHSHFVDTLKGASGETRAEGRLVPRPSTPSLIRSWSTLSGWTFKACQLPHRQG
jgi:hypothetical protein